MGIDILLFGNAINAERFSTRKSALFNVMPE